MNRGLAILGDTLFMGTMDAHLLAIDAKSGQLLWDTSRSPRAAEQLRDHHAADGRKDKVIIGTAGGDIGIRGFVAAYDAKTGAEAWRFYTIPGPGEPGNDTWSGDSWQNGGAGDLERGRLRSGDQSRLLGHRQSGARLGRPHAGSATTSTATASSRSTPTPAS